MAAACIRKCVNQPNILRYFSTQVLNRHNVKVGDSLPDITLYKSTPSDSVSVRSLFDKKKGILFSVPGAFTPGCSQAHIPEYLTNMDKFRGEGVELVVCVTVNDPFVTTAWSQEIDPLGKLMVLSDTHCEFTKAVDMELDCTPLLGNVRSKRFTMIVEDNVVKHITTEPDTSGLACLLCLQKMKWDRKTTKAKVT